VPAKIKKAVKLRPTRLWGWIGKDIDLVRDDQSGYSVAL